MVLTVVFDITKYSTKYLSRWFCTQSKHIVTNKLRIRRRKKQLQHKLGQRNDDVSVIRQ